MKELGFVCAWGKVRETSWSGTKYGLYKHLQHYFNVTDIDIGDNRKSLFCIKNKVVRKIRLLLKCSDMELSDIKRGEKIVKRVTQNKPMPLIQFTECPFTNSQPHFIYQDLYVGHVKKLAENAVDIFKISGFQHFKYDAICKREKYQKLFYEKVDGIFTMGEWLAKELVNEYGIAAEKVFHVGGGVNIDTSKIDYSKKTGNKILFVGRDFIRKNGPLVVEAFKSAKKIRTDLKLYIAGPSQMPPFCNEEGIVFLGDLPYKDLVNYFNLCDVFCMPSRFEAYGLVFIEALTFGLPCIGKNIYEMPYFIKNKETGYLLEDDSADELSKLMIAAIENDEMKKNVMEKRDYYIEKYSWDAVSKRIAAIIENTCKNK